MRLEKELNDKIIQTYEFTSRREKQTIICISWIQRTNKLLNSSSSQKVEYWKVVWKLLHWVFPLPTIRFEFKNSPHTWSNCLIDIWLSANLLIQLLWITLSISTLKIYDAFQQNFKNYRNRIHISIVTSLIIQEYKKGVMYPKDCNRGRRKM